MRPQRYKPIRKYLSSKDTQLKLPEKPEPAEDIFVESEDDDDVLLDNQDFKEEKCSAFIPTLKIEEKQESSSSEWHYEEQAAELTKRGTLLPRMKKTSSKIPILNSQDFKRVQQIDFKLFLGFMAKKKVYGGVLIDCFGRILWCDKVSHELLEASLNNLANTPLTSLLLQSQLPSFLEELRGISHFGSKTIVHWILYSKNTRRRYKSIPFSAKLTSQQIFYRFLKALTVRIRPLSICLPTFRDQKGFCNENLLPMHRAGKCFFLELRLSKGIPNLKGLNILNDPIIKKFVKELNFRPLLSAPNSEDGEETPLGRWLSEKEDKGNEEWTRTKSRRRRKKANRARRIAERVNQGGEEEEGTKKMV